MLLVYNNRGVGVLLLAWLVALVPIGIMALTGATLTEARVFSIFGVLLALIDILGRAGSREVEGVSRFFRASAGGQIMLLPAWMLGLLITGLFYAR